MKKSDSSATNNKSQAKPLEYHNFHIVETDQIERVTIQVAAICSLFDVSRMQYQDLVKNEHIARAGNKRPLLLKSLQRYIRHLRRIEETTAANVDRIQAQTEYTRQRQLNEKLTTQEREGSLIPLAEAEREARHLGVLTRQFCERVITETVKRSPAKNRVKLRGELNQIMAEMLADYADGIEVDTNPREDAA